MRGADATLRQRRLVPRDRIHPRSPQTHDAQSLFLPMPLPRSSFCRPLCRAPTHAQPRLFIRDAAIARCAHHVPGIVPVHLSHCSQYAFGIGTLPSFNRCAGSACNICFARSFADRASSALPMA